MDDVKIDYELERRYRMVFRGANDLVDRLNTNEWAAGYGLLAQELADEAMMVLDAMRASYFAATRFGEKRA